jgi:hypothetical protein
MFEQLSKSALSADESLHLIAKLAAELRVIGRASNEKCTMDIDHVA